jgi:hypothetical protein
VREIVERLCHDLKLDPDWSHWQGEAWDEHYSRVRGRMSDFRQPSRRPLMWAWTFDGGPDSPHPLE